MLSSWVARGHVGLSAGAPVLQILGHEVTQLPTVLLSNHPGFAQTSGRPVATDQLAGMIDALDANGWLASQDALLTGYLPTPEHVALACYLIARLRRHGRPRVIVDPVLGDHPKGLYLPGAVADDLRDRLAPQADTLTPNAFELGWLTGMPTDTPETAATAARTLAGTCREVLLTSAPAGPDRIGVFRVAQGDEGLWSAPLRRGVPNGVGDVFAALVAAGIPTGQALGHLDVLITASFGAPHLRIAESAARWSRAAPLPKSA